MPTERAAVELRSLRHRYPDGVLALDGVNLELRRGELTALVGANGAGKTTLLRVAAGLLAPTAGEVTLLGAREPARPGRPRPLRRRIGYLPQDPALDPEMAGGETLELIAVLHGLRRRERRRRIAELAADFGLEAHLGRRVERYSGGLRRRLHLAAGMVHDPELLLLDEPTAGLDPDGVAFLWAALERRARDGRAVVVVSHDLGAVERHAGRVVTLEGGRIAASETPGGAG